MKMKKFFEVVEKEGESLDVLIMRQKSFLKKFDPRFKRMLQREEKENTQERDLTATR